MIVVGSSLAFMIAMLKNDGWSELCIHVNTRPYAVAATIVPVINDTLVFIAITWRLTRNSYVPPTLKGDIKVLIFGDYLPVFSKAMLKEGQAYYLLIPSIYISHSQLTGFSHRAIVIMNLVALITLFTPSIPEILGTVFPVPNVAVMNIMAGRVFRNTILRHTGFDPSEHNGAAIPLSLWEVELGNRSKQSGDAGFNHRDGITITNTVERTTL